MIVELFDYEPPPRTDTDPWTVMVVERSEDPATGWAEFIRQNIADGVGVFPQGVDTDPANPLVRSIKFEDADAHAWYRVVFEDATGNKTDPSVPVTEQYVPTFLPTLKDVGSLIRSWTKTPQGVTLGTFNAVTAPPSSDVRDLIRQAANEVGGAVGFTVPYSQLENARSLVALRTAMLVLLSNYGEQVATNRTPYEQFERMFDKRLPSLIEAVHEATDDELVDVGEGSGYPSGGGFPTTAIGMEFPW